MKLDEQQKQVEINQDPHLLVLAGPGSGKTETMSKRITFLVNQGYRVAAFSFTKKAANELEERVGIESPDLFIGTFHSFCYKLLKRNGKVNIVPPAWKEKFFGGNRNLLLSVDRARLGLEQEEAIVELAEVYKAWLDKRGLMDFDDLLRQAKEKIKTPPFDYVIVDEAQDNNDLQYEMIPLLGRSITMIGDVDQSIYGFRGAQPSLVRRFQREYAPTTLYLENNYRCARGICFLAQGVIEKDPERFDKRSKPSSLLDGDIEWHESPSYEGDFNLILNRLKSGACPTVLSRSNKPLRQLEEDLAARLWPSKRTGGLWQRSGMKALVARFLEAPIAPSDWQRDWMSYVSEISDTCQWEKTIARRIAMLDERGRESLRERLLAPWPSLLTIHGAKGLEWPEVFIIGLREGEFPRQQEDPTEELRLLYVAITRAKAKVSFFGESDSPFGRILREEIPTTRVMLRRAN